MGGQPKRSRSGRFTDGSRAAPLTADSNVVNPLQDVIPFKSDTPGFSSLCRRLFSLIPLPSRQCGHRAGFDGRLADWPVGIGLIDRCILHRLCSLAASDRYMYRPLWPTTSGIVSAADCSRRSLCLCPGRKRCRTDSRANSDRFWCGFMPDGRDESVSGLVQTRKSANDNRISDGLGRSWGSGGHFAGSSHAPLHQLAWYFSAACRAHAFFRGCSFHHSS